MQFQIPAWLLILIGALVIVFGLFRLSLGWKPAPAEPPAVPARGMFALSRRTHVLVGIIYILMGVMLLLGPFGVRMPWAH